MKNIFILASGLFLVTVSAVQTKAQSVSLATQKDKVSYSIGVNIGGSMKHQGADLNLDAVAAGMKAAYKGDAPALTEAEMQQVMSAYEKELNDKKSASMAKAGSDNIAKGKAFLAGNQKKDGVQTTPSGLQYKILNPGSGRSPKSTDTVVTHYRGTLIDGIEFDSSYKRGTPASFPLNAVIKGWTEGIPLIKEGGKIQLFVPPNLAYGERGAGPIITPNSTLIFEVELLSIQ